MGPARRPYPHRLYPGRRSPGHRRACSSGRRDESLVDPKIARLLHGDARPSPISSGCYLFGIYRYLIPLEMLSPLVIVAAAARFSRCRAGSRLIIMTMLLGGAAGAGVEGRRAAVRLGRGRMSSVDVPSARRPGARHGADDRNRARWPMSSRLSRMRFRSCASPGWMVGSTDRPEFDARGGDAPAVATDHQGPLYGAVLAGERRSRTTVGAFADYGLSDRRRRILPEGRDQCRGTANDLGKLLLFCPLKRISP